MKTSHCFARLLVLFFLRCLFLLAFGISTQWDNKFSRNNLFISQKLSYPSLWLVLGFHLSSLTERGPLSFYLFDHISFLSLSPSSLPLLFHHHICLLFICGVRCPCPFGRSPIRKKKCTTTLLSVSFYIHGIQK